MEPREYEKMFEVEDNHWWYRALHDLILHFLAAENQRKGSLDILDAGCGTGRLCKLMSEYGHVSGCDMSDLALGLCRRRNLPSVFKADLNTFDPGPEQYDVITSIDVLYHKGIRDDSAVLGRLYRTLKPGGILILNLVAYNFLKSRHDIAVHTERRYTKKGVVRLLKNAGFTVEKASYRVGFLFLPIVCYRLFGKAFLRWNVEGEVKSDVHMPPAFVNNLLLQFSLLENLFIKNFGIPFGTSLFAVARKK